jgi:predicted permease
MIESLVLALLGTGLGLLLAAGGIRLLKQLTSGTIPRIEQVSLDATVLFFALAITFIVAMLFGLTPALRLARTPVAQALRREGRGGRGPREAWTGAALLATEVALSLVLLVGAGLLLRSLDKLYRVDLGFDGTNVVRFTLGLPTLRYDSLPKIANFYNGIEERIAAMPGVISVGSARGAPMTSGNIAGEVRITGEPDPVRGQENYAAVRTATAGYLRTMGLTLLRGRWIEPTDRTGGPPVAVVSETFARQNFPGTDPIGKRIRVTASYGYADPEWEIVGVVRDVRRFLQGEVDPEVYVANAQFGPTTMTVHVRARGDAQALIPALRDIVHAADPHLALSGVETVDEAIRNDARSTRLYLFLVSLFAGLAVTLAAVGLYGVVAYIVSRRTREIGIRLALGAPRMNIRRLVLAQGLVPAAVGIGAGLAVAIAGSRVMRSILYEVEPADPLVLVGVSALVLVIAVAASLLPARRATRVDPMRVLRMD